MERQSVGQILRNSVLKLLFEMIGTMFLTLIFNSTRDTQRLLDPLIINYTTEYT